MSGISFAFEESVRLSADEAGPVLPSNLRVPTETCAVTVKDFWAHLPTRSYVYTPTGETWTAASVDSRLGRVGNLSASKFLDRTRSVEQMTWAPGEPEIIKGRYIREGGWIMHSGARCLNLYRPPSLELGDARRVQPWLDHICKVYPEDSDQIIMWVAHRVQKPQEKINHALVIGGRQGIGKDTIFEPVKQAVGPWNFAEVGPHNVLGRFNPWVKSVIIRVSEARDLGDTDRYAFYERIKTLTAAPPDTLRVDEKNLREYSIPNLTGVIMTTNQVDGVFLPAEDRRHYVAWSDLTKEDFPFGYWNDLYAWLAGEGAANVATYLSRVDLSGFDPKSPPRRTEAWQRIVDSGRAPEDADLADIIEILGEPNALTLAQLSDIATSDFRRWLDDRRNRRVIPHRLQTAGYVPVRNDVAKDGMWKIRGRRQVVYARHQLSLADRLAAARNLT
jgi:hypothetical protein